MPSCRRVLSIVACWIAGALVAAGAQAADWNVRALKAQGVPDASFPWVSGPTPAVAERINALLFLDVLEAAPPRADATKFALPAHQSPIQPLTPSGFEVLRLDARVLSISVRGESCGAYCEDYDKAFLFDLADGRRVTDRELLTAPGRAELARMSGQAFVAAIGVELARLARRGGKKGNADEDRDAKKALYTECRDMHRQWLREGYRLGEVRVGRAGADIALGRCSNHAMRALDDLGGFAWHVAPEALAARLTPYGRALLLGEGDARAGSSPSGQVLSGTVGPAAVRLYVEPVEEDGSLSGLYYYERYRAPITVSGSLAKGEWSMTESGSDDKSGGAWALRRDGSGWAGTWTGADGRRLPVRLAP